MNSNEFKKFFGLEKKFENQKIENDKQLFYLTKKGKRVFFATGLLSSILLFSLGSKSYDNLQLISNFLYLKYKLFFFKFQIFKKNSDKIEFLIKILNENVKKYYKIFICIDQYSE